jgi:hypothetical protein
MEMSSKGLCKVKTMVLIQLTVVPSKGTVKWKQNCISILFEIFIHIYHIGDQMKKKKQQQQTRISVLF